MKERGGTWRLWILSLLLAGNLYIPGAECQSRGDEGDSPQSLGFDDVLRRHDGYVKGETPTIPQTSFSCSAQPHNPGLYADTETQCQVYHVCFEDRQESFLCGPGTNFNQRILACDFWYNFNCADSPSFYNVNADIGKVPDTVYNQGQSRNPPPQQPNYPNYPGRPDQPPSVGSIPSRVSIPSPPPQRPDIQRPEQPVFQPQPQRPVVQRPQQPVFQPQPQRPEVQRPQQPVFQPEPQRPVVQRPQQPVFQPQPQRPVVQRPQQPVFQPQPQRPEVQRPQQPVFQPQPQRPVVQRPEEPSFQPQQPIQPQPPRIPQQPQPPRVQPQPPRVQPQPPRVHPQPPYIPQPRPDPPRVSVKPDYPSQGSGHGQGGKRPLPPSIQQEEDDGYQFDGYNPQKPISLPRPPPPHPQTPRPQFPPAVSPPRVSRPPLTPPVVRQPEPSISRPRIPPATRPEYHPDSHLKGGGDYQPPQQPRQPQPSRPVGSGYPSYPVPQRPVAQRPIPQRPAYVPPPAIQQEHIEPEYVPPPPPPRPVEPPRPAFVHPPPPVQQEVTIVEPPRPQRPYVPPQIPQKPIDEEYRRPQPSIVREQQKPASRPQTRPQVSTGSRQPQRPKPVFPPPSDHPYSNIKGGPGYNQPPPQVPRFEPTRIGRPSSPEPVRPRHDTAVSSLKPVGDKRPSPSTSSGYKTPQQGRIKKPSEPPKAIYQPPIQVVDHPRSEIKGGGYREPPQQQQRVKSPSTPVSGVKVPQPRPKPQQQRPRAPVVVSRPQPPSLPATSIKTTSPAEIRPYETPLPQPPAPQPGRIKQPSQIQSVSRPSQPRFPSHQPIDHPNANVKGGYDRPSSPSTSYEQKTKTNIPRRPSGSGYPSPPSKPSRGDYEPAQQEIVQQEYKPQRIPQIKTVSSGVKTRPQAASQQSFQSRQPKPEYDSGSSYTEGPNVYPKPEFGQANSPYQPISTPSRSSHTTKQASPSQNTITQAQNKPAYQGSPASSGFGAQVRPDPPARGVPGYQPPYQPQVFPHRDNPDHPNESVKGSNAYRPPPPAGFQGAASEVSEQQAKPEPATSLLGDIGAE